MFSLTCNETRRSPGEVSSQAGWLVHRFREVASTNDCARTLPAWSAVCAEIQTAGRGRTGRAWISNSGGLWLTAVLPTPGERRRWEILPLAAGWAVLTAVRLVGVEDVRLRWPNDIMIGRRKLAGLLAERFSDDRVAIGIGMNIENDPEAADPGLSGMTTTLAAQVTPAPGRSEMLERILRSLAEVHGRIVDGSFAAVCAEMNENWLFRRVDVSLSTGQAPIRGTFSGVLPNGDLCVRSDRGSEMILPASKVELLREVFDEDVDKGEEARSNRQSVFLESNQR